MQMRFQQFTAIPIYVSDHKPALFLPPSPSQMCSQVTPPLLPLCMQKRVGVMRQIGSGKVACTLMILKLKFHKDDLAQLAH